MITGITLNNASRTVLLLLLTWLAFVVPAAAQSTYGTITGTITDPSGAVIPGAKIETLNQGTKAVRTLTTDNEGSFRFINLEPGIYTLTVSADQFVTVQNKDVPLLAREVVRSDFKLQVQGGGEQIVVMADQIGVGDSPTRRSCRCATRWEPCWC